MKFIKNINSLGAFFLSGIALVIWPIIFGLALHFSEVLVAYSSIVSLVFYILIGCFALSLILIATYFSLLKEYKKLGLFIIGSICTILLLFGESAFLFLFGLVGGATG